ncbi:ribose-phosphate diphosphokinase [Aestuariicoccus sp. MJ-SS9]|uniref:ribose-phosphate diphosphokinase n=1 Tax=Aestuariicoccus sp. MJ-SS9 TaxID=3079855 RepID=UPI00292CCF58|nr:ribose-phosphate diphosphokinase [Aestuariicoccus sp. MJ-SS9]
MLFFALKGSETLGRRVAEAAGTGLAPLEERDFDGGEHKARPMVSVRGRDVFVLHGLQGDATGSANDKLLRLLFFVATCRENGAARVTAIAPYLAYSRKDRQTKPRDPVTTRYVAQLFEAAGSDVVVTVDVHNIMAFQNAFRCRTLHLATDRLFAADIGGRFGKGPMVVVSPDSGGVKRAQLLREALEAETGAAMGFGFMEKRRSAGVVTGSLTAGDVDGQPVCILDDMICGGGTLLRAAEAFRGRGAAAVHAYATHALMAPGGLEKLLGGGLLDSVTVTDSAAPFAGQHPPDARFRVVGCAPLIARAMRALHDGTSFDASPIPLLP